MKKLFVSMLCVAFISVSARANIPAKITDAFHARYPSAINVEWKHMMGNYKAIFNLGDYQLESQFDKNGNWIKSKKRLGQTLLPASVKNSIQLSKYNQWKIKSAYEEYLPNEKPEYHVVAAKGDFMVKNLKFDYRGQLMNG
jgi:hypothetical protein